MAPRIKRKYYNFNELLSRNGILNFVVGARGFGKSYGAKKWAINDYLKNGNKFIYLRRFSHEMKTTSSWFSDIQKEYPENEFRVVGRNAQIVTGYNDKGKPEWDTFGYFVSLSTAQQMKSVSYPDVTKIIFDEFILDDGFQRYLIDEVRQLLDFIVTVDRFRDNPVKTVCMANSTSINNPYFAWFDIHVPDKGQWWRGQGGNVVAHFPDSTEWRDSMEHTGLGALIRGTRYSDYALGNVFLDNTDFLIGKRAENSIHAFDVDCGGTYLRCWSSPPPAMALWYVESSRVPYSGDNACYAMRADLVTPERPLIGKNDIPFIMPKMAYKQGAIRFDKSATQSLFIKIAQL